MRYGDESYCERCGEIMDSYAVLEGEVICPQCKEELAEEYEEDVSEDVPM